MSAPVYTLECAFASDPGSAPVWTDITQHMTEFQITRGRQSELDRIDLGSLRVRLLNDDRQFDPTHAGPYNSAGKLLLPMRRMRLRAVHNAVTYNLFSGFVDSWPQAWEGPNAGFSQVSATDGFRPFALVDIGTGVDWPQEFSGARISRILDAAGWSATDRAIDTGYSEIEATNIPLGSGTTGLATAQSVADAELGTFFCDGRGYAVFHDRHHRRASSYFTPAATFVDNNSGAGILYQDVALDTDADRIWNDIQITSSGEVARSQDTTSQTSYLRRSLARQVSLARAAEAADQADYLLTIYKDPRYRLAKIQVSAFTDTTWVQALGRELSDHIRVKRWPQMVGSTITQECSIESIDLRWTADWDDVIVATWLLSTTAFTAVAWGLLDDATYGLVDSTLIAIY